MKNDLCVAGRERLATRSNQGKLSYPYCAGPAYTLRDPRIDGFLLPTQLSLAPIGKADRAGSNLDATESLRIRSHMLLSFQRPAHLMGGDSARQSTPCT